MTHSANAQWRDAFRAVRDWLPRGGTLSDDAWRQRHRVLVWLVWLHALGLMLFGLVAGYGLLHSFTDAVVVALFAIPASAAHLRRRVRAASATLGLLTASAVLVHVSNGLVEAHFHYFVMLAVIALYQDWIPFLIGVGYVVLEHGAVGLLMPHEVYDHADAWDEPWKWAFIHGVFVLGLCAAIVAQWRFAELTEMERRRGALAHARLAAIVTSSDDAIMSIDRAGRVTSWNVGAERLYGYAEAEMLGQPLRRVVPPEVLSGIRHVADRLQSGESTRAMELANQRKDGSLVDVSASISPILDEAGVLIGASFIVRDITERKKAEAALRTSEARLQRESTRLLALHRASAVLAAQTARPDAVLDEVLRSAVSLVGASSGSLYRWDPQAELLRCVRNFRVAEAHRTLDAPPGKGLAGQTFSQGKPIIVNDYPAWAQAIDPAREGGMRAGMGVPLVRSGKCFGVLILRTYTDQAVQFTDDDARVATLFADQAAAALFTAEAFEQQRHLALHDALTDLPNRVWLRERVQTFVKRDAAAGDTTALLVLDLDRFKEVNDTLGHDQGDLLLRAVAARMRGVLQPPESIARLGGDEFAVLLPSGGPDLARRRAEALIAALRSPFALDEYSVEAGVSIGIALAPEHGVDFETLLRHADIAMYSAKRGSKGYTVYTREQNLHSPERLALVGELRQAIEQDGLALHYQPKLDCQGRRVVGLEALVRWLHPEHGLILPDRFIPLAEETGLIGPLTEWVIDAALRQCRAWRNEDLALSVAVNLSTLNLHDAGLVRTIQASLQKWKLPANALELEITESSLMGQPERALVVLGELSQMGIRIAVDDFGTGYSSLAYLKELPAHELKIDQCFVRDMRHQPRDLAIVRSTIDLAHHLGLRVVAEGVEDVDTWELLGQIGCDVAQGYYLSRPMAADRVLAWIRGGVSHLSALRRAA